MGAASTGSGMSEASVRCHDCGGHLYDVRIVGAVSTGSGIWNRQHGIRSVGAGSTGSGV